MAGAAAAAVLAGLAAACAPVVPVPESGGAPPAGSVLAGCDRAGDPITVEVSTHLDPSCEYHGGLTVVAADVVLDCRGALVEDLTGEGRAGILVRAPADVALAGVTVRNCRVRGFLNSVRIQRTGFKDLPAGGEYEHPFADIVVERSVLSDSRGSGVFVDGYVTDVTLRHLEISGAGSVGVYLEAGSRDNVVEHNSIHDNGFGDVRPEGIPFTLGGVEFRYRSTGREGIAVDGSRGNVIRHNWIADNSAGGVFLYKNCGEYVTEKPRSWWERRYGADGNRIEHNVFADAPNGVWLGSRMGENQVFMDCSDPAYVTGALTRVHLDLARDNVVRHNVFLRTRYGVRVEDDGNRVEGNWFLGDDAGDRAVVLGTSHRTAVLARPVASTVVRGNEAFLGDAAAYGWAHGHTRTTFARNRADGLPAALVARVPPPVDPFLFVREFWLP